MLDFRVIRQKLTVDELHSNASNSFYGNAPVPYPSMQNSSDYEVQVHVNFVRREMRLLKVIGASEDADIYLFTREKCSTECSDPNCSNCRTRKVFQDKAVNPQGLVPYTPNQEYMYCMRFDSHPITALLAFTPRDQDVEVKEKCVLAYWFMKWFERTKIMNKEAAVKGIQRRQEEGLRDASSAIAKVDPAVQAAAAIAKVAPAAQAAATIAKVAPAVQAAAAQPPPPPPKPVMQPVTDAPTDAVGDQPEEDNEGPDEGPDEYSVMHRGSASGIGGGGTTSEECTHKNTANYLPNMKVIYQVKKDQMSIVLPKPEQLGRPIDVSLVTVDKEGHGKQQAISLMPGDTQSSSNLVALRNTPYTLQVQLHDRGRPVDLLDFITENKILRVQESKDAPKQLNFLMERLSDQRGTFVLHITFDEKIVEVGTKPIGEFYIDVDVDTHKMLIGTIASHAAKHYRVEKISKQNDSNVLLAEKQVIFEGGVDPATLTIRDSIPIERMSDYVITVVDPVTKQCLPTSVLAFHKHALFVKEIKNSDVRLHVTVQRQPTAVMSQSSNANNLRTLNPVFPIKRFDPSSAFHCPFRNGWSNFRIHHSTSGCWIESPPHSSQNTTPPSSSCDCETLSKLSDTCFGLDVDLPALKARLVASTSAYAAESALFIVYEESFDGKMRSTPCHMSQAFKIGHWCKYTVKCIEGSCLMPLLTFCVTDKEVIDIRPCSSSVQLSHRLVN